MMMAWKHKNSTYCIDHNDVIIWKICPHYWPFVRGIHRSPVDSPRKGPIIQKACNTELWCFPCCYSEGVMNKQSTWRWSAIPWGSWASYQIRKIVGPCNVSIMTDMGNNTKRGPVSLAVITGFTDTVRSRYPAVTFFPNNSWKTPIARPLGRGMGVFCEFEVGPKLYIRS